MTGPIPVPIHIRVNGNFIASTAEAILLQVITKIHGVKSRNLGLPTGELSVTMSHFGTMPENRVLEGEMDGYP